MTVVSNLSGVQVTTSLPEGNRLPGMGTAPLGFALTAGAGSASQGKIVLRVTSTEGARLDVSLPVTVASVQPRLVVRPTELRAGMKVGGQALVSFDVINEGGAASGPMQVALPDLPWLHVASPQPHAGPRTGRHQPRHAPTHPRVGFVAGQLRGLPRRVHSRQQR